MRHAVRRIIPGDVMGIIRLIHTTSTDTAVEPDQDTRRRAVVALRMAPTRRDSALAGRPSRDREKGVTVAVSDSHTWPGRPGRRFGG